MMVPGTSKKEGQWQESDDRNAQSGGEEDWGGAPMSELEKGTLGTTHLERGPARGANQGDALQRV